MTEDATDKASADSKDFLKDVRDKFERAAEREDGNRKRGLEDLRFARKGEQWPSSVKKEREDEGRPCLTINKMPAFIRQVVNDARQNKPAIVVHPVDSGADVETAEIMSGLIRNIEVSSDADVAYDTAVECAVSNSFGYFQINTRYSDDDTFAQDLVIERIANPFSVFGDPDSEAADSSDWNCAWVVTTMPRDEFERKYKGAEPVDYDALGYTGLEAPWCDGDDVMVCAYWHREEVEKQIVQLDNGTTVDVALLEARPNDFMGRSVVGSPRTVRSKKVTQYILTGAEVLETIDWPGKYIPIIPVYGDEVNVEGKRELYSLIHFSTDSQREYNYHRSAAVEMVALAPKAPFVGKTGAFDSDPNWATANTASHPYLEYDGDIMPQRQGFTGAPIGEMQLAMQANEDIKATMGLFDASLGARSNETSGRAIRARQMEGDVSTFHFIDNLTRAIRHCGRVLLDLIPKVYPTERIIRVLGQDMRPQNVQISPQAQQMMQQAQESAQQEAIAFAQQFAEQERLAAYQHALQERLANIQRVYDVTAGKYDLTVKVGPGYSSQREETRAELVEIIRSVPGSAQVLGPMYLRNSDWPGADEAADKIEAAMAQANGGGENQQVQALMAKVQQLEQENQQIQNANGLKVQENQIKAAEARTKAFEAETDRIRAQNERMTAAATPIIGTAYP